jgi:hypothetical protein
VDPRLEAVDPLGLAAVADRAAHLFATGAGCGDIENTFAADIVEGHGERRKAEGCRLRVR